MNRTHVELISYYDERSLNEPSEAVHDSYYDRISQHDSWIENCTYSELNGIKTFTYPDGRTRIIKKIDEDSTNESYMYNGRLHRLDGPALISHSESKGGVEMETWYKDGRPFRDNDLPTKTTYRKVNEMLRIAREEWLDDEGLRHRENGKAARLDYSLDGLWPWPTGIYYNHGRFDQSQ